MTRLWLITAGTIVSGAIVSLATRGRAVTEIWLGMLAPLLVAVVSWKLMERVYREHPERLTALMMKAFAAKLIFFGAYVGLAIGVFGVQPIPFIVSFTSYFIALHLIEALGMKRLFVS